MMSNIDENTTPDGGEAPSPSHPKYLPADEVPGSTSSHETKSGPGVPAPDAPPHPGSDGDAVEEEATIKPGGGLPPSLTHTEDD